MVFDPSFVTLELAGRTCRHHSRMVVSQIFFCNFLLRIRSGNGPTLRIFFQVGEQKQTHQLRDNFFNSEIPGQTFADRAALGTSGVKNTMIISSIKR